MGNEISKEVRDRIGVEKIRKYTVTARDIHRFTQAIGEKNPRIDSDGKIIAPPLFCQVFMFEDVAVELLPADGSPTELDVPIPAQRAVGGGSDFETLGDVKENDVITVTSKLKDVSTKQGKSGLLYLLQVETSFQNQKSKLVARETATYVKRI